MAFHVGSEVGRLRRVIVHRPDLELKRLTNIPADQPVALTTRIDPNAVRNMLASFNDTTLVANRPSVRAAEPTLAMTCAPPSAASCTAKRPTPPAAEATVDGAPLRPGERATVTWWKSAFGGTHVNRTDRSPAFTLSVRTSKAPMLRMWAFRRSGLWPV